MEHFPRSINAYVDVWTVGYPIMATLQFHLNQLNLRHGPLEGWKVCPIVARPSFTEWAKILYNFSAVQVYYFLNIHDDRLFSH